MGKLDLVRESHSISEIAVQLQQRVRRGRSGNGHSISEIAVQLQQRSTTNLAGGGGARAPENEPAVDREHAIPNESAQAPHQNTTHTLKPHEKCGHNVGPHSMSSNFSN